LNLEEIENVAVIGAGFISTGVAQNFAANGYDVCIYDIKPEQLPAVLKRMRNNLLIMAEKGNNR
jgi:3-hydroxyacyl-CoA dehydrogenase